MFSYKMRESSSIYEHLRLSPAEALTLRPDVPCRGLLFQHWQTASSGHQRILGVLFFPLVFFIHIGFCLYCTIQRAEHASERVKTEPKFFFFFSKNQLLLNHNLQVCIFPSLLTSVFPFLFFKVLFLGKRDSGGPDGHWLVPLSPAGCPSARGASALHCPHQDNKNKSLGSSKCFSLVS